jgi:hypothetical protein
MHRYCKKKLATKGTKERFPFVPFVAKPSFIKPLFAGDVRSFAESLNPG